MKVIEVRDLVKTYLSDGLAVHALRGVTLLVEQGDFAAIMGPSGSGKSTLMNQIGCLDRPTRGAVIIEGTDTSRMSKTELASLRNRKIGFVFQTFNLLARTTALANIQLPLLYAGVALVERTKRAHEALREVGLGDRARHRSNQLSGGEQQRVAIARALVTRPSIILADEPTGNLDTRSGLEVMSVLQRLNDEGITILVVTHDRSIAEHARRIVSMRDGRIIRDEVVPQPRIAPEELAALPPVEEDHVL
jgi:putative ABC transport system ATP-binding protein